MGANHQLIMAHRMYATITAVSGQAGGASDFAGTNTSISKSYTSNVTSGNLLVVVGLRASDSSTAWSAGSLTKSAGTATIGTISLDRVPTSINLEGTDIMHIGIWSCLVTGSGSLTFQLSDSNGTYRGFVIGIDEYSSSSGWDSSRAESGNSGGTATNDQTAPTSGNATSAGSAVFVGGMVDFNGANQAIGQDAAFSVIFEEENGATSLHGSTIRRIVSGPTTDSADWTIGTPNGGWMAAVQVYKPV